MSTSLLYHAFGIRGYVYSRTQYDNGQVIFTIHQEAETYRCSACGSSQVISRGQGDRRFRSLPIGGRPHVRCPAHPARGMSSLRVGASGRDLLRRPEAELHEVFREIRAGVVTEHDDLDVALHLNVGWDLIKDIQKRDLSRRYAKPKLKHLRTSPSTRSQSPRDTAI